MLKVSLHIISTAIVMASGAAFGQQDLVERLMDADEKEFAEIFPAFKEQGERRLPILSSEIDRKLPSDSTDEAKEKLSKRQANAAVVLLRMNQPEKVWPLLKHSPDPRARSYLIHRLGPLGVDSKIIIKRLDAEPDITICRALILSLGEFDETALSLKDRTAFLPKLQAMYRTDADPGLHSAAEWLLRKWNQDDWLKQTNEDCAKGKLQREKKLESIQQHLSKDKETSPQWFVTGQGQTMVVIPGPVEFMMGSPTTEFSRSDTGDERQHQKRIGHSFAISTKEVTVEQFLRFNKEHGYNEKIAPTVDCPMGEVTWFEAAAFCNWLSDQEGIPKEQWYYESNMDGIYNNGMKMASDSMQRTGYRLPTEAEWEYACRAGSITRYSFGEPVALLDRYAWFSLKSSRMSHPAGSLKPNDFGLFDMHGNIEEWCQDLWDGKATRDQEQNLVVFDSAVRVLRGGSFKLPFSAARSADRAFNLPTGDKGFRLARTLRSFPDKLR